MKQICNCSPLRYPGGKAKLYDLVNALISQYGKSVDTYVEPFAGGAGVALGLLLNHQIDKIIINDINIGVFSFWSAVCKDTDNLLRLIRETEVNICNFDIQRNIYNNETQSSLELGFATFFLNRTCYSGVLGAGPIGGHDQNGKYLLDARYNRFDLMKKIERIAQNSTKIEIFNLDILDFISQVGNSRANIFTYFDPPYFVKGKALYTNFLNQEDHEKISNEIKHIKTPWLITYDNVREISNIYQDFTQYEFSLSYTVNPKACRRTTELLIASDVDKLESINKEIFKKIDLKKKELTYA